MGTAAYGGIGLNGRAAVSGDRPLAPSAADHSTPRCHANAPPPPVLNKVFHEGCIEFVVVGGVP